ncbi:MAG: DUF3549 family protein [Ferrimonas sp.]
MSSITTLEQFLNRAGTQFRVFDLSRRVVPLSSEQFQQFEQGLTPYPYPRAGYAWLGILFWDPNVAMQHYVWFLKWPLDEQGLINPAARNQFLQTIVEALGQDPTVNMTQQQRWASNPFIFSPSEEKMAVFHANVRLALAQPASVYYEAAQEYFSGQRHWQQWQTIGLQGVADYAARLDPTHSRQLAYAIAQLPHEALLPMLSIFEHFQLADVISQALLQRLQQESDELNKLTLLRGLAGSPQWLTPALTTQLQQPLSQDALIIIAARLWLGLDHTNIPLYLDQLAQHPGMLFNQLYLDLVAQPHTRVWVLAELRNPQCSPALTSAIHQLMNQMKTEGLHA